MAQQRRATEAQWADSLKAHPCADCFGVFPPECMDWDHRPDQKKGTNVGHLAGRASRERVLAEIAKCDLVCANCHRIRTRARGKARRRTIATG